MTEPASQTRPNSGKGKAFFDRGDQVAETGNWDFAIQLYVDGIRREPGNVQRGHQPLREVALKRRASGGKAAGLIEQLKRRGGKTPEEALANAQYLLAKDPGNVSHMVAVLKAAQNLPEPAPELIKWICDILLEAMRQAKKPNLQICKMTARAYSDVEAFAEAVQVCDIALSAYPDDVELGDMARNLSARETIKHGQYDSEGSFVGSVRDMDQQIELAQKDQMAQSREFLERQIQQARAEYEANPTVPGKIDALVDALLKVEEEGYENEAIDVLKKAHADSEAYRFKMRMDDIRIRQMRRRVNALKSSGDRQAARQAMRQLLAFELEAYAERAANYPTDLSIKFELGRRQLLAGKIDDAIASLQQAQRDPKRRLTAMTLLGNAFAKKGWHREAVETYRRALDLEPTEERAKELHYSLATSLEAMGEKQEALDHLSRVAQIDYNYRDVRDRIEALRKELGEGAAPAS